MFWDSGANQSVYAPEPFDVGRILQADIISNGQKVTVTTDGPIDPGWFSQTLTNPLSGQWSECLAY